MARWREHGQLAMQFMAQQGWRNVIRYVHCDPTPEAAELASGVPWDGMGIVVFRDAQARSDHIGFAQARQALEADEDQAFALRVNRCGLVAREEVLRSGPPGALKLARVFQRLPGVSAERFLARWADEHVPRIQASGGNGLLRHVANWPLAPENGKAWGLACAVIEELWFATVPDLRRTLLAEADALQRQGAPQVAECLFALPVRETVLVGDAA